VVVSPEHVAWVLSLLGFFLLLLGLLLLALLVLLGCLLLALPLCLLDGGSSTGVDLVPLLFGVDLVLLKFVLMITKAFLWVAVPNHVSICKHTRALPLSIGACRPARENVALIDQGGWVI
jgi:hypothetical protein